jgi:hypothetical protein
MIVAKTAKTEKTSIRKPSGPFAASYSALRGFGIGRLEIGDHGDKGGSEGKQCKKMPYFPGQEMFAYVFHGLILILAQGLLVVIRIVLVLGRTFQEYTVFLGDLEHIAVHLPFQGDAFGLFQVVGLLEMIGYLGGVAQRIADMKAHVVGILIGSYSMGWYYRCGR